MGQGAQREIDELGRGAKTLSRAHTSSRRERKSVLKEQESEQNQDHSADFNTFVKSVLDAEEDLQDDSLSDGPPTRQSSWESQGLEMDETGYYSIQGRDEMYLPQSTVQYPAGTSTRKRSEGSASRPTDYENTPTSVQIPGPAQPPKVPESQSTASIEPLRRQVLRKPVNRFSISAESTMSDATLAPPTPIDGKETSTASAYSHIRRQSSGARARAPSDTNLLFNQASRSLSSLAEDFMNVGIQDSNESPPPYANPPASLPVRDVKRRDTQGSTRLGGERTDIIQVVRDNEVELLLAMLDQGVGIDEVDPVTKRTAIMEATHLRRTKISQILIRSGSRLHLKDIDGNSALHFAARNGDANTCVLLLDAGAQLVETNRAGETPLDLGARGGHTETVTCLLNSWALQNGSSTTLLQGFLEASKSGNASTAQAFIERGINPKKSKEPWKPIAYAAQSGSIPMIDLMLAQKCNLKDRSPDG